MQDCLDYLEVLFLFPKLESSRAKVRPDAEALEGYRNAYAEIAHAAVADVSGAHLCRSARAHAFWTIGNISS